VTRAARKRARRLAARLAAANATPKQVNGKRERMLRRQLGTLGDIAEDGIERSRARALDMQSEAYWRRTWGG
jgi:hypothetical protein